MTTSSAAHRGRVADSERLAREVEALLEPLESTAAALRQLVELLRLPEPRRDSSPEFQSMVEAATRALAEEPQKRWPIAELTKLAASAVGQTTLSGAAQFRLLRHLMVRGALLDEHDRMYRPFASRSSAIRHAVVRACAQLNAFMETDLPVLPRVLDRLRAVEAAQRPERTLIAGYGGLPPANRLRDHDALARAPMREQRSRPETSAGSTSD